MQSTRWTVVVVVMLLATGLGSVQFLQAQSEPGSGSREPGSESRDTAESTEAETVTGPRLIAVKFHADWCGYCKTMGNVFDELQEKFDEQPVLWVTFDHTRKHHRRQSQYLAHAMDLSDVWAEHGGKTGFILLIDADSREVIQSLTHEQSIQQMGAELVEAVERASL